MYMDMYIGAPYLEKNNIGTCLKPLKLHMVMKSNLTTIEIRSYNSYLDK